MQNTCTRLFALTMLSAVSVPASADYETMVLARDLAAPTGILFDDDSRSLYFTEVPTPGVGGGDGGMNRVSILNIPMDSITVVSAGEPEPVNLAMDGDGSVYWTCKSAGVILQLPAGADEPAPVLTDLREPSGIVVARGIIVFTEVPTPGVGGDMGGENGVYYAKDGVINALNEGEPEPTDITVTPDGSLYWTCKSAGVILRRTLDGEIAPVLTELNAPTGIDSDRFGRIFFTEVPTPGVGGDDGGMNRILRYDPSSGELIVIDEGDPEPTDVTVSRNGRFVFWTCTSAGVIVAAREN